MRAAEPDGAGARRRLAQRLGRLGVHLPLFLRARCGALFTAPRGPGGLSPGRRRGAAAARVDLPRDVRALLRAIRRRCSRPSRSSEVVEKASVVAPARRAGGGAARQGAGRRLPPLERPTKSVGAEELPLDPQTYADADLVRHFRDFDAAPLSGFLRFLAAQQLHVYTCVEQIDLDTLRLLGVFRERAAGGAAGARRSTWSICSRCSSRRGQRRGQLLARAAARRCSRPSAPRACRPSPSTATRRSSGSGNLDSLVLSEFAYDEDLFERKVVDDELYYYGHEKQREEERRLQYMLVDSSPSMRGVRQVFARGLALDAGQEAGARRATRSGCASSTRACTTSQKVRARRLRRRRTC